MRNEMRQARRLLGPLFCILHSSFCISHPGGFVNRSFGPNLRVLLPSGWAELHYHPPGRVFRAGCPAENPDVVAQEAQGGWLRITVDEPLEVRPGETIDERLWAVLDE